MKTLEETVELTHDWAVDRIHYLCDGVKRDPLKCAEDAYSIHQEFAEWFDPDCEDDEVFSIEYMPNWD